MQKIQKIQDFITLTLQKKGFSKVVIGASGGIDSSVVLALLHKANVQTTALLMPSLSSKQEHFDDAKLLCESFKINYKIISITPYQEVFLKDLDRSDQIYRLRVGNFCARMRAILLYDASLRENALVIGTSNKTELALGYGTLHGDLAWAFNPIGGLFKTQIFDLARELNLPKNIISKPPSADLWEGQSDEGDFGFSYAQIDAFLSALFNVYPNLFELDHINEAEVLNNLKDFKEDLVKSILKRINTNLFKHKRPDIFNA
ncbi:MAG: NAD+ synthase [Helicobacter sp.]|nr:NAD+ synthase [Helicobacter sp.]